MKELEIYLGETGIDFEITDDTMTIFDNVTIDEDIKVSNVKYIVSSGSIIFEDCDIDLKDKSIEADEIIISAINLLGIPEAINAEELIIEDLKTSNMKSLFHIEIEALYLTIDRNIKKYFNVEQS